MIRLHRLSARAAQPFHLNPDLIVTIEATPDTVVTLPRSKVLVVRLARAWSPPSVRAGARRSSTRCPASPAAPRRLSLVRGTAGDGAIVPLTAPTTIPSEEPRSMKFGTRSSASSSRIGGIAMGATMEGSNPMAVLNVPAILIVLGGTLGATIVAAASTAVIKIPKLYMKAFNAEALDLERRVVELVGYAEQARRDGLLALDEVANSIEDPFTQKGLQLVVDGTDPDLVADVLESENEAMRKRHAAAAQPFDKAGGSPRRWASSARSSASSTCSNNLDQPRRSAR